MSIPSFHSQKRGQIGQRLLTLKNVIVDPPFSVPYCMLFCAAKSAALCMGNIVRSTVRNAAKLAVYEERIMRVKNHQIPPTMRVDVA